MVRGLVYKLYERRLLAEVRRQPMPRHLGLIQDGHRRYTRESGLASRIEGYRRGAEKTEEVLAWCGELGIPTITLWWLSTENLGRQSDEVADVLRVIEEKMTRKGAPDGRRRLDDWRLKAAAAFYGTPAGKAIREKLPKVIDSAAVAIDSDPNTSATDTAVATRILIRPSLLM